MLDVGGWLTRAAFTPGLMIGLAGAVYGFRRKYPGSNLPSPFLLEGVGLVGTVPGTERLATAAAKEPMPA